METLSLVKASDAKLDQARTFMLPNSSLMFVDIRAHGQKRQRTGKEVSTIVSGALLSIIYVLSNLNIASFYSSKINLDRCLS